VKREGKLAGRTTTTTTTSCQRVTADVRSVESLSTDLPPESNTEVFNGVDPDEIRQEVAAEYLESR
jgi:hypothetical protein